MLSIASSIYDPLGLFSPFVLEGRQIIQMFCLNQLAWDNPVGEDIQQKCSKQKLSLNKLQEIKLNRCYKLNGFGKVASCSLHDFFDASKKLTLVNSKIKSCTNEAHINPKVTIDSSSFINKIVWVGQERVASGI